MRGPPPSRAGALRQVAAFAPMCAFAAAHWSALVADPPVVRVAAIVAIATACGLVLVLSQGSGEGGGAAPRAVRVLAVAAASVAALLAAGLPAELLAPTGWDELAAGLRRGLDGLLGVQWPYSGGDFWVRETVLLALPLICLPAAAFALWPPAPGPGGPEAAAARRAGALVLLLSLFAVAATERPLSAEPERGALLLVLLAAWLFLPRLARPRPAAAVAAGAAVLAAGLISLPIAAALEPERPWVDYGTLSLAGGPERGRFDWDHSYGPLRWPRTGETMLEVRSERPHFWKMQTLDRFDGEIWRDSGRRRRLGPEAELAPFRPLPSADVARLGFTVRGLRSSLLAGAGTPLEVQGAGRVALYADGTSETLGPVFGSGDAYSVNAYVPEPGVSDLDAAGGPTPAYAPEYLAVDLPSSAEALATTVNFAPAGSPEGEDRAAQAGVLASPYAGVYRLARRLARGRTTPFQVASSIEDHLRRSYRYDERAPAREDPLAAFLLEDRAGHCQHFSGAMALMLRMNGIPARVATGFAPGERGPGGAYRVRDLDAHSWVEVLLPGVGWVAFDPTPGSSPAARPQPQAAAAAEAGRGRSGRVERRERRRRPQEGERRRRSEGGLRARGTVSLEGTSPAATVGLAALVLGGLLGVGVLLVPRLRRRASEGRSAAEDVAELRTALERLGWSVPARTTLTELERRLADGAGPAAARYARRLRQRRFASPHERTPPGIDRRALRRALTEGGGLLARLRVLLALPPAALRPRRRPGGPGGPTPA